MAEGKRPGGLTALAVLNFVFGGLGALGLLGLIALIAVTKKAIEAAESLGGAAKYEGPSMMSIYIIILLGIVSTILMIMSGVGYLKQKRFLGRTLGNGYAVTSIASTVVSVFMAKQGFGVFAIIGLIYPVLTLILINGTFKDDLVN
jgi:hypothetical protein